MPHKFKKGQVVKAIWRAFTLHDEPIPTAFSAKIKKLAELGVPLTDAERVGGPGVDNNYAPYQAFELGVALKLLDAGFKQGEVAELVKHARPNLRRSYSEILDSPPAVGQNILAKDRPKSPPLLVVAHGSTELADPNRRHSADTSYWLTFRSLEFPQSLHPRAKKGELRLEPQFHRGLELLAQELQNRATTYTDDHRFVLELSNLAMMITNSLPEIQPTQRGRQ
jgi:hypothetical protein